MAATAIERENERIVRDYVTEIWQDHRFDRVPEFVADSVVYDDPTLSTPVRGPRELYAHLRRTKSSFSDFHVAIDALVAEGDVVAFEWTLTAIHDGPMGGIPPTGRRLQVRGMSIHRLEDDKLVADRAYWDMTEVRAQLGLDVPAILGQLPKLAWRKLTGPR